VHNFASCSELFASDCAGLVGIDPAELVMARANISADKTDTLDKTTFLLLI
jgi:hypothetical protein